MNTKQLTMTMATALISVAAFAQSPVIDGVIDAAFYGSPLAVQDTPTTFGNASNHHTRVAVGGSELDQVFARVSDGMLWLFAAGNLETMGVGGLQWPAGNENKLDIFIDSIPGGQNSIRGDNANVDNDALNRMGHLDPANDGLKFDTGMEPDFFLTFNNYMTAYAWFDPPWVERWNGNVRYATMPSEGGGIAYNLGNATDPSHQSHTTAFTLAHGVRLGFNNSNTGGVNDAYGAAPDASDAANVTTGLELGIPLALIDGENGEINSTIKITLFINDINHGYLSNQTLGPLGQPSGSYGNLAEPRTWSFTNVSASVQYVTLSVPITTTREIQDTIVVSDGDGDPGALAVSNSWIAGIDEEYRVDYSTNLVSGIWTNVSGIITADAAVIGFEHTNMTSEAAYYRIMRIE